MRGVVNEPRFEPSPKAFYSYVYEAHQSIFGVGAANGA